MKTSMLEYCKAILHKVSFNRRLFLKEYKKSILWLPPSEAGQLKEWLRSIRESRPSTVLLKSNKKEGASTRMKHCITSLIFVTVLLLSGCSVVRQGEVGMKRRLGKLSPQIIQPGAVGYNPFVTRVIKMPIRTMNMEISTNLPSKEGLNVTAVISILYRIVPEKAPSIVENIGVGNEPNVISSVFRSSAADVCSRFFAKDMHSAQRAAIEKEVSEQMSSVLAQRGFEIEAVLLKNISLPDGLARAVEEKLEAEQDAQRMEFLLERERMEAQRKKIEAEGIRDAQKIISEGLTKSIIEWQSIEAFRELAKSPNAKVLITDGNAPLLINTSKD